jgi:hypothetical protein
MKIQTNTKFVLFIGICFLLSSCTTPKSSSTASPMSEPAVDAATSTIDNATPAASDAVVNKNPSENCTNQYYPVTTGATWQYAGSNSTTGDFSFVRSITAVYQEGFVDQDVFDGGTTRTGTWACAAGDLSAMSQGGVATVNVPTNPSTATLIADSTESDGVTLPATLTPGESWNQAVKIAGTMKISEQISAKASNDTEYICTAVGQESVSVPAGTFNGMKVTCDYVMNIEVEMEATGPVSTKLTSTSNMWYVAGVGLVKIEDQGDIGLTTIELQSYSIPGL